ncbi:hypothetical protein F5882DRAFT_371831 [Hyaloscypha sp. PMI_1271]|nr:hypothetical protein F5882DRAFT_371831 [Hyaloscypha sp. PMI_1271]
MAEGHSEEEWKSKYPTRCRLTIRDREPQRPAINPVLPPPPPPTVETTVATELETEILVCDFVTGAQEVTTSVAVRAGVSVVTVVVLLSLQFALSRFWRGLPLTWAR